MELGDPANLVRSLLLTREKIEELLFQLHRTRDKRDWTRSEELTFKTATRTVRKISNEYLPWARLKPDPAKSAEIMVWLVVVWSELSLTV